VLSEFATGCGLSGEKCGPEAQYTREKGEAAWARLIARHGEKLVRETIEAGRATRPHINADTQP